MLRDETLLDSLGAGLQSAKYSDLKELLHALEVDFDVICLQELSLMRSSTRCAHGSGLMNSLCILYLPERIEHHGPQHGREHVV